MLQLEIGLSVQLLRLVFPAGLSSATSYDCCGTVCRELACSICLCLFQSPCTLPCQHSFCKECALHALRSSKDSVSDSPGADASACHHCLSEIPPCRCATAGLKSHCEIRILRFVRCARLRRTRERSRQIRIWRLCRCCSENRFPVRRAKSGHPWALSRAATEVPRTGVTSFQRRNTHTNVSMNHTAKVGMQLNGRY